MKKASKITNLSTVEAIVLQQLHEDGEGDISLLSQQLSLSRGRVASLIDSLKQKGLLIIQHDYQGTWIRLSRKGNRLMAYVWPEARLAT